MRRRLVTLACVAAGLGGLVVYLDVPATAPRATDELRDAPAPPAPLTAPAPPAVADTNARTVAKAPTTPPAVEPDVPDRDAEHAEVADLDAPIPFPADLDPRHAPDAVEAWADALADVCPAARDAVITVDCSEFPCVVAVAWTGDTPTRDVACRAPDLADARMSEASGVIDDVTVSVALLPVGPPTWPPPDLEARWAGRWETRTRALREEMMDEALAQHEAAP